jgi:antirestriction protein ArdC
VKLGIELDFNQSAAYVEGWLEAFKNEKSLIFKAASEAQKAVDFIMDAATATETQEKVAA